MSQTDPTPAADPTPGRTGLPIAFRLLLAFTLFIAIALPATVMFLSYMREQSYEARSETLSEKYGVEIKNIDPVLRGGDPVTWSVDGTERECVLSRPTDTLRCDDGTGALVEIGQTP